LRGRPLIILLVLGLAALAFFDHDPGPEPLSVGTCLELPSPALLKQMEDSAASVEVSPSPKPCAELPNLLVTYRGPLNLDPFNSPCPKSTTFQLDSYDQEAPETLCVEEQS
jgi:hypothetical protein